MTNRLNSPPNPTDIGSTIVDILDYRATHQGDRLGYEFRIGKDKPDNRLTYRELDRRAKAIANELISRNLQNERVLLIYPAGLKFIAAFIGCLCAGALAVPLYPPRRNQKLSCIQNIVADCDAKGILTICQLSSRIESNLSKIEASLDYIFTDSLDLESESFKIVNTKGDIAILNHL